MRIFLKHLWSIPNTLKWQDCKIFTKPEAATGGVLEKKLFLKICEVSQENTCVGVSV